MAFSAYAVATSIVQGKSLDFHITGNAGELATVDIFDVPKDTNIASFPASAPTGTWSRPIPRDWPSSLYKAVFNPNGGEAYFVVRSFKPDARTRILVSIPFATWQAYNQAGQPGKSIYWNEQP